MKKAIGILYNFSFFVWLHSLVAPVILSTNPGYLQVWSKSGVQRPGEELWTPGTHTVLDIRSCRWCLTTVCTMMLMPKSVSSHSDTVKDPFEVRRASSVEVTAASSHT